MTNEEQIRHKFGVPRRHKLEEQKGWWNQVNADIRVWAQIDENGHEVMRFKREEFMGDTAMFSIVRENWR